MEARDTETAGTLSVLLHAVYIVYTQMTAIQVKRHAASRTPEGYLLTPPVIDSLFLLSLTLCGEGKVYCKQPRWFCKLHSQYLHVSFLKVQVPLCWGRKALC